MVNRDNPNSGKRHRPNRGQTERKNERERLDRLGTRRAESTCPSGKITYRSKAAATRDMIKIRSAGRIRDEPDAPIVAYPCRYCPDWHIGHSRPPRGKP